MSDDRIVRAASKAIENVFSDTTVKPGVTKSRLRQLRDEIDILLDTLSGESEDDDDQH